MRSFESLVRRAGRLPGAQGGDGQHGQRGPGVDAPRDGPRHRASTCRRWWSARARAQEVLGRPLGSHVLTRGAGGLAPGLSLRADVEALAAMERRSASAGERRVGAVVRAAGCARRARRDVACRAVPLPAHLRATCRPRTSPRRRLGRAGGRAGAALVRARLLRALPAAAPAAARPARAPTWSAALPAAGRAAPHAGAGRPPRRGPHRADVAPAPGADRRDQRRPAVVRAPLPSWRWRRWRSAPAALRPLARAVLARGRRAVARGAPRAPPCPGASDNASGVAAVLALVRAASPPIRRRARR